MEYIIYVALLIGGFFVGFWIRKQSISSKIKTAEEKAEKKLAEVKTKQSELLLKAQEKALAIIEEAKKEAGKIVEKAEARADEIRKNVLAELKLSTNQSVSAIKQKITDLITLKLVDKPVKDAFQDKGFIKKIIE